MESDHNTVVIGEVLRGMGCKVTSGWYLSVTSGDIKIAVAIEC
jgi:hypothetical protein